MCHGCCQGVPAALASTCPEVYLGDACPGLHQRYGGPAAACLSQAVLQPLQGVPLACCTPTVSRCRLCWLSYYASYTGIRLHACGPFGRHLQQLQPASVQSKLLKAMPWTSVTPATGSSAQPWWQSTAAVRAGLCSCYVKLSAPTQEVPSL
jgi:hypothetical protein